MNEISCTCSPISLIFVKDPSACEPYQPLKMSRNTFLVVITHAGCRRVCAIDKDVHASSTTILHLPSNVAELDPETMP